MSKKSDRKDEQDQPSIPEDGKKTEKGKETSPATRRAFLGGVGLAALAGTAGAADVKSNILSRIQSELETESNAGMFFDHFHAKSVYTRNGFGKSIQNFAKGIVPPDDRGGDGDGDGK